MKIGILTYHRAYNYGAHLQACALCNRLNEEVGIEAEIIDFQMEREKKQYEVRAYSLMKKMLGILKGNYIFQKKKERSFKKALNNPVMRKSDQYLLSDSIDDFTEFVKGKYDAIVVGSDEVWKVDNFRGFPSPYWLFGDLNCKKFAYAASSRVSFRDALSVENYSTVQKALQDFQFIGVRDQITYKEVKRVIRSTDNLHLCCDPSFLYDFIEPNTDVWERLSKKHNFDRSRKTIIVMLDNIKISEHIKKSLPNYNLVSVYRYHRGYINFADVEPLEWLSLIKHADFIIASFYHAICFSIVYNKPFIAIGTNKKKSKLSELLEDQKFELQYIDNIDDTDFEQRVLSIIHSHIDYTDVVKNKRESFNLFLEELKK